MFDLVFIEVLPPYWIFDIDSYILYYNSNSTSYQIHIDIGQIHINADRIFIPFGGKDCDFATIPIVSYVIDCQCVVSRFQILEQVTALKICTCYTNYRVILLQDYVGERNGVASFVVKDITLERRGDSRRHCHRLRHRAVRFLRHCRLCYYKRESGSADDGGFAQQGTARQFAFEYLQFRIALRTGAAALTFEGALRYMQIDIVVAGYLTTKLLEMLADVFSLVHNNLV